MHTTAAIVPPSAPSFVAEVAAMLGRRFDSLSADDKARVMGGGRIAEIARASGQTAREAFVAAMLDTTLRSYAVEASYYGRPIGPARCEFVSAHVVTDALTVGHMRVTLGDGSVEWWGYEQRESLRWTARCRTSAQGAAYAAEETARWRRVAARRGAASPAI